MAFFKFRGARASKSEEPTRSAEKNRRKPIDTVETLRRSARHRLVGAAVLVVAAVIGFPLLFETEPRPVPVNAPVTIPDRHHVAPLAPPQAQKGDISTKDSLASGEESVPAPAARADTGQTAPAAAAPATPEAAGPKSGDSQPAQAKQSVQANAAQPANPSAQAATTASDASAKRDANAAEDAQHAAAEAKKAEQIKQAQKAKEARDAREAKKADAARALAALQGRSVPDSPAPVAADDKGRFVVQIGAFSDVQKATTVRRKALSLGLQSYTQALKTKDGQLTTRVRVGPFASRADAERAAATLKRAGLAGQIISS
jgi:DedD protein